MLKYPCLVLDHDDTLVKSEETINYPYFCYILDQLRPGKTITFGEYVEGCFHVGFAEMCRQWYGFTEQEMEEEYQGWKGYIRQHIPAIFPGVDEIVRRQKERGGLVCVVSHSCEEIIRRDYQAQIGVQPDAVYGWELPEEKRKPSPFPLEDIMDRFHLKPDQLLLVDDMRPGYDMAKKAGVPTAYAGWGREAFPEIFREMKQLCDFSFASTKSFKKFLFD